MMHYTLHQNELLDSSIDTNIARIEVLVIVLYEPWFCNTVKTKKTEVFTAVSMFDQLDLFDSELITLKQWAYEKILFGLFGLELITLK